MRRSLLLIDRGSREEEVNNELKELCLMVKDMGNYDHVGYCFLEVVPPFIEEGIRLCNSDLLTIIPYFLYPGTKMKDAISKSTQIANALNIKFVIGDCLHNHQNLLEIIKDRVDTAKSEAGITIDNDDCYVLLIGHGSVDRDARKAFEEITSSVRREYGNVDYCFLELDQPDIEEGITNALKSKPQALIIVPYFLHKGAHIKHDVREEVSKALRYAKDGVQVCMSRHLGVDRKIAEIVIDRAREAEAKYGI